MILQPKLQHAHATRICVAVHTCAFTQTAQRGALKLRLASHQALHVTSYNYIIDGYSGTTLIFVKLLLSDCGLRL